MYRNLTSPVPTGHFGTTTEATDPPRERFGEKLKVSAGPVAPGDFPRAENDDDDADDGDLMNSDNSNIILVSKKTMVK